MKEINNCKIVQDLLPNYIEQLTDTETNLYIEEHIKGCNICRNILDEMTTDANLNLPKRDNREIQYMKKFKNKLKNLKFIIISVFVIIIVLFLAITVRKMIIISNLSNKAEEYANSNNYHRIDYIYNSDGEFVKQDTFILENKIKMTEIQVNNDHVLQVSDVGQIDNPLDKEKTCSVQEYINYEDKKVALGYTRIFPADKIENTLQTENLWELFKCAISTSIKEKEIEGKECYYIDNFKTNMLGSTLNNFYVDKETGLLVSINGWFSIYKFGSVKEAEFTKDDLSNYMILNTPEEYVEWLNSIK